MDPYEESSEMAGTFIDDLIQLADKYDIDREHFVKACAITLFTTIGTIDFKHYECEKGE